MKKSNRHCFSPIRLLAVLLAGILLCSSAALAEIKVSINGVEQEPTKTERPSHEVIPPEMMENSRPEASDIPEQNEKAEEPEAASPEDLTAKGKNPAPSFTCASSITVGKNLTVTVKAVKNAVRYYLNIIDPYGKRAYISASESAGKQTIDGLIFDEGKYTILLCVEYADGSDQRARKTLTVTDPNSQRVDQEIQFTVQGNTHLVNDTVVVTLSSPDAEKFAVRSGGIRYSYGGPDEYYSIKYRYVDLELTDYKEIKAEGGKAEFRCYINAEEYAYNQYNLSDLLLEARAYHDGKWTIEHWKIIDIEEPEWLEAPDVDLPEEGVEGQDVLVKINRAEHEYQYEIQVNQGAWLVFKDEEYYIPEEMLIPGQDNTIDVYALTEDPGWANTYENHFSGTVYIYRDEERPEAPRLTTEKTTYWMDEDIIFTAESSEAETFRFRYEMFRNGRWGGPSQRIVIEPEDGRAEFPMTWLIPDNTTKFRVWASAQINGHWSEEAVAAVEIQKRPGWVGDVLWFPLGLTEIEDYAFMNTNTKRIEIPATVTRIGKGAFSGNPSLRAVFIYAIDITIEKGAFDDCPRVHFYVVRGSDAEEYLTEHGFDYRYIYY